MQNECIIYFECKAKDQIECNYYSFNSQCGNRCWYLGGKYCTNTQARVNKILNYLNNVTNELFNNCDYLPKENENAE